MMMLISSGKLQSSLLIFESFRLATHVLLQSERACLFSSMATLFISNGYVSLFKPSGTGGLNSSASKNKAYVF